VGDVNLQWNADAITRRLEEAVLIGLGNAGQVLHRRAVSVVDKPYPPASQPGEPPRKRSGILQKGLTVWIEKVPGGGIMHMGWRMDNPVYARHLVDGTWKMKARPTMPVVFRDRAADVVQTVAEALRRALR
jgi:hypothetical protein